MKIMNNANGKVERINYRRISREIANTARLIGAIGPHRLLNDVGRAERNLTDMHRGTRFRVEELYRLAGDAWIGKVSREQVAAWL